MEEASTNCYGAYLRELFSDEELRAGTFTAVGAVHRPGDDTNLPRFVGHYWPEYDHELSYSAARPKTFHQYVAAGWSNTGESGDVHAVVEQVAEGILRAVQIAEPATRIGNTSASTDTFSNRSSRHRISEPSIFLWCCVS